MRRLMRVLSKQPGASGEDAFGVGQVPDVFSTSPTLATHGAALAASSQPFGMLS